MSRSGMKSQGMIVLIGALFALSGCDPASRHNALSTFFDGVPPLRQAGEAAADGAVAKKTADGADQKTRTAGDHGEPKLVSHQPYAENRCPDCHSTDKETQGGLVVSREKLCFVCHQNFFKGAFQHGPAAFGDCLACHLPHRSSNEALLIVAKDAICTRCHKEERQASGMHERFTTLGIRCIDCHDPHSGANRFFLK